MSGEPEFDGWRFGRHVRSCRKARGLTQEHLAERAGLAVDMIRRTESGRFSPSTETVAKVCHGLNMQISTLFAGFEFERDVPREINDAIWLMRREEQELLLRLLFTPYQLVREALEAEQKSRGDETVGEQ